MHCIDGYAEQLADRQTEIDILNHALARYIGFAINDPKNFPEKPFSQNESMNKSGLITTDEALEAHIRARAEAQESGEL
jgi:hypothetical protein|nr:MAG TPA: hypothetical protein [Caudoviricetes sp.]